MTLPQPRPRRRKPLDAGVFSPEIGSFRLHLAADGKAAKTVRTYTEAVAWFAAGHLIPRTSHTTWEQVSGHDVQRWLVHLLSRYSDAYASNQRSWRQAVRAGWMISLLNSVAISLRLSGIRPGGVGLRGARWSWPTSAAPPTWCELEKQ